MKTMEFLVALIVVGCIFGFIAKEIFWKTEYVESKDVSLNEIPQEGLAVPVRATFRGIKGVPLLSLAHNSLSPKLRLYTDKLVFKVITESSKRYSDIESVDVSGPAVSQLLSIRFRGDFLTLEINVGNRSVLQKVVDFLKGKGVSLTARAEDLLSAPA